MKFVLLACFVTISFSSEPEALAQSTLWFVAELVVTGFKSTAIRDLIVRESFETPNPRRLNEYISYLYQLAVMDDKILDYVPHPPAFEKAPVSEVVRKLNAHFNHPGYPAINQVLVHMWWKYVVPVIYYRDWRTNRVILGPEAEFVMINGRLFIRISKDFWKKLIQDRVIPEIRRSVTMPPFRPFIQSGEPEQVPSVVRLADIEENRSGREITPLKHKGRYNVDHILPMGEGGDEANFFANMDYFEKRIPALIRARVLETLSAIKTRIPVEQWMELIQPTLNGLMFSDNEVLQLYVEYLLSFLYMDENLHHELVRVNKKRVETTATQLAQSHSQTGGKPYITAEIIFEWYQIARGKPSSHFYVRYDGENTRLVNVGPLTWSSQFIIPRLQRLLSTGSERRPFVSV